MRKDRTELKIIMVNDGMEIKLETLNALDKLVEQARLEGIGWMYGEACASADVSVDIRSVTVPSILEKAKEQLK